MQLITSSCLITISTAALVCDLNSEKVPNVIPLTGLLYGFCAQILLRGIYGLLPLLAGAILPILLLWPLFHFRALGAGDVKLLAALGSMTGAGVILHCILYSLFAGAFLSILSIIRNRSLVKRFSYLFHYIQSFFISKRHIPYYSGDFSQSSIYFTIPIFISICFHIGGIY